ncbi:MAG: ATP-dependent DNA helicase RecG, partial [Candidatus Pacebacteria bacterium]|nr:ATP-dependent DNA helicase RecG [Candidatus Paceibacterota bacterium]
KVSDSGKHFISFVPKAGQSAFNMPLLSTKSKKKRMYPDMIIAMPPEDLLEKHFRLVPTQKAAFSKLKIKTVRELLYHFPARYGNTSEMKSIRSLVAGENAVIFGKINGLKASKGFKTRMTMAKATVSDETGKIQAVWFNQPYIAKMVAEDSLVRVEGKVSARRKTNELYFSNPKIEPVGKLPIGVGENLFGDEGEAHTLYPVYPESRGITSNWIYHAIQKIFKAGILETLVDPIPEVILKKYSLPTLATAIVWMHAPKEQSHAEAARKRFAFEEVFFIQLENERERIEYQKKDSFIINRDPKEIETFIKRFPFEPTNAQRKAISHILDDFKSGHPMSRLLEGDVGSGKTAVAATTVYTAITTRPKGQDFGRLQVAYMAPTEILAKQHFESFIQYFRHLPINIALITSSGCKKFPSKVDSSGYTDISRNQLLKWVEAGEIPILIGTHALIQKAVKFKNLAYIIIDEQHRFGVAQRQKLRRKDDVLPHLLSMTATPIPRTLALTIFGDLDLTLLDEMPVGRKPIITEVVLPNEREKTYEKIRTELKAGRQVYIICPRIDEPDPDKELAIQAKSVKEEAKRLKEKIFPEYEIEILHSKMKPKEKDDIMAEFTAHNIHILVATSVVEVGVNVPNATVIVIEGAERFGLAQLHQLRGRVIRSNHQAYCYIFTESNGQKTIDRLKAFKTAKNGFELAEEDLKLRGAGSLSGGKQWGVSDLAMEAIKNIKMVEAARLEAKNIIASNPELKDAPLLKARMESQKQKIHFE